MNLILHRVAKLRYASLPTFEEHGVGAARYGGRWNSPDPALRFDRRIIYASDTLAQAMLEVIVHVDSQVLHSVAHGHVTFEVDYEFVVELSMDQLPPSWNAHPETPATQVIGDEWYDLGASAVLRIPSAVLPPHAYGPGHANYLIHTQHPDLARAVRLRGYQPLSFDPRL